MSDRVENGTVTTLRGGLVVIPVADGVIVEGARNRHVFRGRAATTLLPDALARLREPCTPKELAGALRASPEQVARLLAVLGERGLLEPGPPPRAGRDVHEEVVDHFSRVAVPPAGAARVLGLLAAATVVVAGADVLAEDVCEDLRACGVGMVTTACDALAAEPATGGRRLAVVLETPGADGLLGRIVGMCRGTGVPVLRVRVGDGHIELGPCFRDDLTACPRCLRRARGAAGWGDGADEPGTSAAPAADPATAVTAAGLAAARAVAIVGELPGVPSPHLVTRLDTRSWETESRLLVREEDCPCCGDMPPPGPDPRVELIHAYEESVASGPAGLYPQPDPTPSWQARVEAARAERPALDAHPALDLPGGQPEPSGVFGDPPAGDLAVLDTTVIGAIARMTAGLRSLPGDPPEQRWAPSGGNMASTELYVWHGAGVAGLPGTLFRYDDLGHRLIAARRSTVSPAELTAGTDLAGLPLEAVFVFVTARERLAVKYGDFAYRLGALDAGCATTQFTAVCHGYGLAPVFASRWDGRVAEVLRVGPDDRFIAALAGLVRPDAVR